MIEQSGMRGARQGTGQVWHVGGAKVVRLDCPRVLGIVNVTPDSFSDGGSYHSAQHAAETAAAMLDDGADGVDIGGESTRPGAARVDADEQIRRTLRVIELIRSRCGDGPIVSIDTTLSEVAERALAAGADVINDIAAGAEDPRMFELAAHHGVGLIVMHRLKPPGADSYSTKYSTPPAYDGPGGVVGAVRAHLNERVLCAVRAGVAHESIVVDPGLGFGKSVEQNLELIGRSGELSGIGAAVLSAVSRKSFTARAAGLPDDTPAKQRVQASVGLSVAHLLTGARVFRVHDVREHAEALRSAWRVMVRGNSAML